MSDPVSNAEVEDVLSSIRRLVSEEKRSPQGDSGAPSRSPAQNDRLVLTPSLRVAATREVPEQDVSEPDAPDADTPEDMAKGTSDLSIDSLVTDDEPLDVYGDTVANAPSEEYTTEDLATDYSGDPYGFDDPENVDGHDDAEEMFLNDRKDAPEDERQSDEEREIEEAIFEQLSEDGTLDEDPIAEATDTDEPEPDPDHARVEEPAPQDATMSFDRLSDPDAPVRRGFLSARASAHDAEEEMSFPEADHDAPSGDARPAEAEDLSHSETGRTDTDTKAAALSAKIAALETAIGKISDTWEPDDAGESEYAGTAAPEVMAWEDDKPEPDAFARPTLAPVLRKLDDIERPDHTSQDDEPGEEAGDQSLHAPEEEAETGFEQSFRSQRSAMAQPGPQGAAVDTVSDEIHPSEDMRAPEPEEEPEERTVSRPVPPTDRAPEQTDIPQASVPPVASLPDDDHLLDEEALRDLVSEIVRAELQGALGERITRNVRKLVRREIHRALTAQELE